MIVLIILLNFLGSFCLYNTSEKAILNNNIFIEKWLQENNLKAKIIGIICYIISLVFSINHFGITAGILYLLITTTVILSLLIIGMPTQRIHYRYIFITFFVLFIIQFLNL
ncbi:hypothetical protein [Tenacibaculum piscium]|uniref:Uncharacterized protein n=1 Tax=Tenacibaculum piscium TaxID=1458515 RepID=A0A2H1YKU0_9FLAO|nr:hypothetical protein [Tenacibaculum piscium]MBE7670166.1 hypothetical protein [Tenacibaculum piscium]MBE7685409.1 hypothetical protein [Tenacibaculum piscium]MBE7689994.1 hypothetical protein [Tenacibaculum piscium]SOS75827.1 conserved hypothetical protein [Tenacibaculum piscium]